jgi:membrane fusion protein, copper/silver efflux system
MKIFFSILSILILLIACDTKRKKAAEAGIKYTCSMHPQVLKDEPGKCPICHMDLIPVKQAVTDTMGAQPMNMDSTSNRQMDSASNTEMSANKMAMPNEIELTDQQIRLANIQADTIGSTGFGSSMVLTGTIAFNEKNIETISSRVKGRIERLYYKNTGDYIPKGAKVYELYSEDLNSIKQEYILLLQKSGTSGNSVINFNQLLQAARHKLQLWGMTAAQIRALEQTRKASYTTAFYSPASGYITQLNVTEGDYVMEGGSMIRLANTSSVWVETQAYSSQLSQINRNAAVIVQIPQLANKKITGSIEFVSPEINPQTRINLLRVNISNPNNQLKPGMVAYIFLSNTQTNAIALPLDAIMRNGNMAYVWIKTGNNRFKMQSVTLGAANGNQVGITNGLKAGDVVVITGAYLLNSEYLLRNGGGSMEGMKM